MDWREILQESPIFLWENRWFQVDFHLHPSIDPWRRSSQKWWVQEVDDPFPQGPFCVHFQVHTQTSSLVMSPFLSLLLAHDSTCLKVPTKNTSCPKAATRSQLGNVAATHSPERLRMATMRGEHALATVRAPRAPLIGGLERSIVVYSWHIGWWVGSKKLGHQWTHRNSGVWVLYQHLRTPSTSSRSQRSFAAQVSHDVAVWWNYLKFAGWQFRTTFVSSI